MSSLFFCAHSFRRALLCLSICAILYLSRFILNLSRRYSERRTSCRSAIAVNFLACSRRKSLLRPLIPLYSSLMSASIKLTLGARFSKKALAKPLLKNVILTWGYCCANALMTGTVIATSPIAENLMTSICSCLTSYKVSGWLTGRCTFSFVCTPSCICDLPQYLPTTGQ